MRGVNAARVNHRRPTLAAENPLPCATSGRCASDHSVSAALDDLLAGSKAGHAQHSFWVVLAQMAQLGVLLHLLLILLFVFAGVPAMAWLNGGSALLLATCARLLRQRRNVPAMTLIVAETLMHAIAAVAVVGWDGGFHYYVVPLVASVVASESRAGWGKAALVGALAVFYMLLDAFARLVPPLHSIDATTLGLLRYFNLGVTFAILGFTSLSYQWRVRQAAQSLHARATTDPLTGLYNRSRLLEIARYEQSQRRRRGGSLSMLIGDIDWFKAINDRHGHAAGDAVLCAVSAALRRAVREQDSVARWGGEEFLVLLPDTSLADAAEVAERIRTCVAALRIPAGGEPLGCTMTLGVAMHAEPEDIERCISRADAALYRGKDNGRNRVELAQGALSSPSAEADLTGAAAAGAPPPLGAHTVAV